MPPTPADPFVLLLAAIAGAGLYVAITWPGFSAPDRLSLSESIAARLRAVGVLVGLDVSYSSPGEGPVTQYFVDLSLVGREDLSHRAANRYVLTLPPLSTRTRSALEATNRDSTGSLMSRDPIRCRSNAEGMIARELTRRMQAVGVDLVVRFTPVVDAVMGAADFRMTLRRPKGSAAIDAPQPPATLRFA